jgi:hypothetical protein
VNFFDIARKIFSADPEKKKGPGPAAAKTLLKELISDHLDKLEEEHLKSSDVEPRTISQLELNFLLKKIRTSPYYSILFKGDDERSHKFVQEFLYDLNKEDLRKSRKNKENSRKKDQWIMDYSRDPIKRANVASLIKQIAFKISSDRTLSNSVRDAFVFDAAQVVPGELSNGLYDTNPAGKGFDVHGKKGFVSFAIKADSFSSNYLIGGILFKLEYDSSLYKSESDDSGKYPTGLKHSKGLQTVTFSTKAGYYNKLLEGGYSSPKDLGGYIIDLDDQENIIDSIIVDPAKFKAGVNGIVNDVLSNPPPSSQSTKYKGVVLKKQQQQIAPTTSARALLQWIVGQKQTEVFGSQINNLAQALSAGSGSSFATEHQKVTDYFKNRNWVINHNK